MSNNKIEEQAEGDFDLRKQIQSELLQYKAELGQGLNQLATGKTATELSLENIMQIFAEHNAKQKESLEKEAEGRLKAAEHERHLWSVALLHELGGDLTISRMAFESASEDDEIQVLENRDRTGMAYRLIPAHLSSKETRNDT